MTLKEFLHISVTPLLLGLWLSMLPIVFGQSTSEAPSYMDPAQPVEKRMQDLLARMTLKEKVGQLNMPCVYLDDLGKDIPAKLAACKRFAEGTYTDEIGPGAGSLR